MYFQKSQDTKPGYKLGSNGKFQIRPGNQASIYCTARTYFKFIFSPANLFGSCIRFLVLFATFVFMYKVLAYQVADSIDIKACKINFKAELVHGDSEELFYHVSSERYIYIFKYGVVSFLNFDPVEVSGFLQFITPFGKNLF